MVVQLTFNNNRISIRPHVSDIQTREGEIFLYLNDCRIPVVYPREDVMSILVRNVPENWKGEMK